MPRTTNSTSVNKPGPKALPTSGITKQNVNEMKPLSKKKEVELTAVQVEELQERVNEILRQEGQTLFIKDAKDEAIRLVNAMTTSNIEEMIPRIPRGEQRTNNFSVFIGRLNPPHKFHLISLITAILIARSNGTPALFLLGDGGGPNIDNPLDFNLKVVLYKKNYHNLVSKLRLTTLSVNKAYTSHILEISLEDNIIQRLATLLFFILVAINQKKKVLK
jgi:hypothetical protein